MTYVLFNKILGKQLGNISGYIPESAVKTYQRHNDATVRIMELGGIHADQTPEVEKLIGIIIRANREIVRKGWFMKESI